jgi:hypothetical protein
MRPTLATARAVVVDDDPGEAMTILQALASFRIGALYYNGQVEDLPPEDSPLRGVRLLVLDMQLSGASDTDTVVGQLLAVLRRLFGDRPERLVIATWTKHSAHVPTLKARVRSNFKDWRPIWVELDKTRLAQDRAALEDSIAAGLREAGLLRLIWHWEQCVHDAATDAMSALQDLVVAKNLTDWNDGMAQILAALALAGGGSRVVDPSSAYTSLFSVLNPIHEDRLGQLASRPAELMGPSTTLRNAVRKLERVPLSAGMKGDLNRMLALAQVGATDQGPQPGNVYLPGRWFGLFPIGRERETETFSLKNILDDTRQVKKQQAQDDEERTLLLGSVVPALVEVTPACDWSQGKVRAASLLGALFWPTTEKKLLKRAGYLRELGPYRLSSDELEGEYLLVVNSLYRFTPPFELLDHSRESWRLRAAVLIDLQVWSAGQGSRPGYTSL